LSFGIIHGANDLLLLKININNNDSIISLLIPYLIMVISSGIFFYFTPSLALIFFVLFSSYHFGEHQWTIFIDKKEKKLELFYFIYGLFLFSLLFWLNNTEVGEIIFDITGLNIDLKFYDYLLYFSTGGLLLLSFLNFRYLSDQFIVQSFLLILLSIIFYNSSLILSFGIYFVFWHSIPSIIEQSQYIYGSNNMTSFLNYFKSSFLYWTISIIGLLLMYYFLKDYQNLLISIFFSFLAAITFPHTLVIFKIKSN
jgi:Brp/Blh family beta-carotene 15,15'-monooxygenase